MVIAEKIAKLGYEFFQVPKGYLSGREIDLSGEFFTELLYECVDGSVVLFHKNFDCSYSIVEFYNDIDEFREFRMSEEDIDFDNCNLESFV